MLSERLKKSIRDYPDFPKEGILFKDICPILADPELFSDLINKVSSYKFFRDTEAIIAIDARGFIFGSAVAHVTKKPLILARKRNKLPGEIIENNYGLEYGKDSLSIQVNAIRPYTKFVIIDDLLATGGTANCIENILTLNKKEVLALSVIIELSALKGKELLNIPVFSELKY